MSSQGALLLPKGKGYTDMFLFVFSLLYECVYYTHHCIQIPALILENLLVLYNTCADNHVDPKPFSHDNPALSFSTEWSFKSWEQITAA